LHLQDPEGGGHPESGERLRVVGLALIWRKRRCYNPPPSFPGEMSMASESSFDIVCRIDLQEVDNAIQQVMKEIRTRYDFRGSVTALQRAHHDILPVADDETKRKNVVERLSQRLAAGKVSLKGLPFGRAEKAAGGTLRQKISLQQGIASDQAKEIVKRIKES